MQSIKFAKYDKFAKFATNSRRGWEEIDSPKSIIVAVAVFFVVAGLFFVYAMPAIGGSTTSKSSHNNSARAYTSQPELETALSPSSASWNY